MTQILDLQNLNLRINENKQSADAPLKSLSFSTSQRDAHHSLEKPDPSFFFIHSLMYPQTSTNSQDIKVVCHHSVETRRCLRGLIHLA